MTYWIYAGKDGYWRWRLLAANNKIVADSGEGYANKQDCLHGITLVKSSAAAPVYEAK